MVKHEFLIRQDVGDLVAIRQFPESGLRIFITSDEETGVRWVVIRGTANLENTLADIDLVERESHELQIQVHRCFDEATEECLP